MNRSKLYYWNCICSFEPCKQSCGMYMYLQNLHWIVHSNDRGFVKTYYCRNICFIDIIVIIVCGKFFCFCVLGCELLLTKLNMIFLQTNSTVSLDMSWFHSEYCNDGWPCQHKKPINSHSWRLAPSNRPTPYGCSYRDSFKYMMYWHK